MTAFEAKSRTQAKANNNFSSIQNLFARDPEGNIYYPSEYCGSWIDGEYLCVALTDTSEKIVEKYRSAVDYKDNIKFEKMQSSLNTLNSQANEYASYLESKNIVCSVFVNEEKNKCVIEVIDDTEANVLNVLKSEIAKISFYLNGALNSEVLKYGQKSGFSSANIVAYNVPVVSEDGITIKGVTKCIVTSGKSTKGDSGGPYVVIRDDGSGNFSFIGIHQGAPSKPTSDPYVYFTPCEQFINYFVPQTWL